MIKAQKESQPLHPPKQKPARQHDQGPAQQVALQATYCRAQLNHVRLVPADFLALQRTVGNRYVQRMMAQHSAGQVMRRPTPRAGTVIQRMLPCPAQLMDADPIPAGWQAYHGDPSVFHCGFRGILENRSPTPNDPQNECFYDHSGALVDETHPYAGCRGTPNQYDSAQDPLDHAFMDTGGIWHAGGPAFITSRVYDLDRAISSAIQVVNTAGRIIRTVADGLKTAVALGVLTATASVDPGNWNFQGLPARSVRHLNVMGAIIGSATLSQNIDSLLRNLTRRLDSFPIAGLLNEIAQDINQIMQSRGGTAQPVTASLLGALSLLQLVDWLREQGVVRFIRPPEDIAREQLAAQAAPQ
jgi:hypothetical protein